MNKEQYVTTAGKVMIPKIKWYDDKKIAIGEKWKKGNTRPNNSKDKVHHNVQMWIDWLHANEKKKILLL